MYILQISANTSDIEVFYYYKKGEYKMRIVRKQTSIRKNSDRDTAAKPAKSARAKFTATVCIGLAAAVILGTARSVYTLEYNKSYSCNLSNAETQMFLFPQITHSAASDKQSTADSDSKITYSFWFLNCLTQFKNWEFCFEVEDLNFASETTKLCIARSV
jgi:hypothetical protein